MLVRMRMALVVALAACGAPPAPAAPAPARTTPLFEFHSDPWVNLHQRLVAESTAKHYWHVPVPIPPCGCARTADGDVLPAWTAAVDAYKTILEKRDTVVDRDLVRTNLTFALLATNATLPEKNVDPAIAKAIGPTFEPYMRTQWPIDDARNRAFIAAVEPLVARWATDIAAELEKRFEAKWPGRPIRVEVAQFAGFGGAYTVDDPILTTMSSDDPGYVGPAVLEMLFHEASHGFEEVLDHDLQMAFIAKGKRQPQSLQHAIIFYTAGELVRKRLGAGYVPYAYKEGVWKRGWEKYEVAMRTHWQPWMDDQIDLQAALSRLADAFPE
jgi:hypothetical protein